MCGIAGLVNLDRSPVDASLLARMAERLAHRGPDERQVWIDPDRPHLGLAHARLAVLDRPGGRQPMADPAHPGRRAVYNGEIYNHRELRQALLVWNHAFASDHSDTEVLLPLYHEYGPDMVDQLRGMFAFAVVDGPARRLLLAVDRMGQKPLYWLRNDRYFAFASELKALLTLPGLDAALDLAALDLYLQLGYVPAPATIFQGIRKLPPASRLVLPLDDLPNDPEPQIYWSPPLPVEEGRVPDDDPAQYLATVELLRHRPDLIKELRRLLTEAVRIRLEADVPLGFFLSGGLDSSLVLALARSTDPRRELRTFSVAFPGAAYDESRYAALAARDAGAVHTTLKVEPGSLLAAIESVVAIFDEPFADASAIPTHLLARAAREHITVALSGDGGDEAFGGYDRYRAIRLAARLDRLGPLAGLIALAGRCVPRGRDLKSLRSRCRRFTDALALAPLARYARWVSPFHERRPTEFYGPALRDAARPGAAAEYLARFVPTDRPLAEAVMRLDALTYLPGDVLVKVDRASMACGLEVRSPLLDHQVVEFAMRLPARMRLGPRAASILQKLLLREVAGNLLPRAIRERRKMGFGVPVSAWLATSEAQAMTAQLTAGPLAASGLVDMAVLNRYLSEHIRRRADHGPRLYSLLVLDQFLRHHK